MNVKRKKPVIGKTVTGHSENIPGRVPQTDSAWMSQLEFNKLVRVASFASLKCKKHVFSGFLKKNAVDV
jgi:hypothetical protein